MSEIIYPNEVVFELDYENPLVIELVENGVGIYYTEDNLTTVINVVDGSSGVATDITDNELGEESNGIRMGAVITSLDATGQASVTANPYQLFKTQEIVNEEYCLVFDSASQTVTFPLTGAWSGELTYDDGTTSAKSGTGDFVLDGTTPIKITKFTATDTVQDYYWEFNQTRGDYVKCHYTGELATLVGFPADGGYVRAWGVGDGLEFSADNYVNIPQKTGAFSVEVVLGQDLEISKFTDNANIINLGSGNPFLGRDYANNQWFAGNGVTDVNVNGVWSGLLANGNSQSTTALETLKAGDVLSFNVTAYVGALTFFNHPENITKGFTGQVIKSIKIIDTIDTYFYDFTAIRGNSLKVPETINGQDGTMVDFPNNGVYVPEQNKTLVSGSEATGDAVYSYENYGEIVGFMPRSNTRMEFPKPSSRITTSFDFYLTLNSATDDVVLWGTDSTTVNLFVGFYIRNTRVYAIGKNAVHPNTVPWGESSTGAIVPVGEPVKITVEISFTPNCPYKIYINDSLEANSNLSSLFGGNFHVFGQQYDEISHLILFRVDRNNGDVIKTFDSKSVFTRFVVYQSSNVLHDVDLTTGDTYIVPDAASSTTLYMWGSPTTKWQRVIPKRFFTEDDFPTLAGFNSSRNGSTAFNHYEINTAIAGGTLSGFPERVELSGNGSITSPLILTTTGETFISDLTLDDVDASGAANVIISNCEVQDVTG